METWIVQKVIKLEIFLLILIWTTDPGLFWLPEGHPFYVKNHMQNKRMI